MLGKNKNGCFDCDRCPKNADPEKGRFCVAWLEMIEKNNVTGETRIHKSCGIPKLFMLIMENSAAADRVTSNLTALPRRFREEFPLIHRLNAPESN